MFGRRKKNYASSATMKAELVKIYEDVIAEILREQGVPVPSLVSGLWEAYKLCSETRQMVDLRVSSRLCRGDLDKRLVALGYDLRIVKSGEQRR